MTEHKFKIGQLVDLTLRCDLSSTRYQDRTDDRKRLPWTEDGEFQYEIRSNLEEYNRIAPESELTRTPTLAVALPRARVHGVPPDLYSL